MEASLNRTAAHSHCGEVVRHWRRRRQLSLRDLAQDTGITLRQLAMLERGHIIPTREIVMTLSQRLAIPLRDRNALLSSVGFEAGYAARPVTDPALSMTVNLVLAGHEPNPAFAIDRHWQLAASNASLRRLIRHVDPTLLAPPINMLRLMLHPAGLAPRILNLRDWRQSMIERLRHRLDAYPDPHLAGLLSEIREYPAPFTGASGVGEPSVPLRLVTVDGTLAFLNTTTHFGAAMDVTLAELTIETFYPADEATVAILSRMAVSVSDVALPATAG